jgi:hypothetical protein
MKRYLFFTPILFIYSCKSKLDSAYANVYRDTAIHEFIKGGYHELVSSQSYKSKIEVIFTNNPWEIKETDTVCIRFSKFPIYYGPFKKKLIAGVDTALANIKIFQPRLYIQRGKDVYVFNTDIVYNFSPNEPSVRLTFSTDNNDWTRFVLNWPQH